MVFPNKKLDNSLVLEFCQGILNCFFQAFLKLANLEDSLPSISPHIYFNGTLIHKILINIFKASRYFPKATEYSLNTKYLFH